MKSELEIFDAKIVKKIHENYKVVVKNKRASKFLNELKDSAKQHEKLLYYKNLLDNGKIKEEDIPQEYVEELRVLYYQEIAELKRKLK